MLSNAMLVSGRALFTLSNRDALHQYPVEKPFLRSVLRWRRGLFSRVAIELKKLVVSFYCNKIWATLFVPMLLDIYTDSYITPIVGVKDSKFCDISSLLFYSYLY